jgi:hypothetical protein
MAGHDGAVGAAACAPTRETQLGRRRTLPRLRNEAVRTSSCHLEVGDLSFCVQAQTLGAAGGSLRSSYNRKLAQSRALPYR